MRLAVERRCILHAVMREKIGERHASACRYKKTRYRRAHAAPLARRISGRSLFPCKPIPNAADGLDEVGGVSEFFAEGADVDVDGAFKGIGIFTA